MSLMKELEEMFLPQDASGEQSIQFIPGKSEEGLDYVLQLRTQERGHWWQDSPNGRRRYGGWYLKPVKKMHIFDL